MEQVVSTVAQMSTVAGFVEKKDEFAEIAAPYIAKLNSTKETIASDKRVQQALAGIKELKEHPRETALALKEKAVDLIKYESLESYRAYVCSDEFQESTARGLI